VEQKCYSSTGVNYKNGGLQPDLHNL